tara:strand:- start:1691 stop:2956 length:1266 start_codon:yes stop_codon:yes gene_type:complete
MANRYPLILDSSNNKIKELPSGDNLDLTGAGISSVSNISVGTAVTIGTYGIHATGVITATSFVGDITGDVTGNAATATALASARNIGGVSFDGTADINLPGVNQSGTQNTSGTAGGLSGSPDITVGSITASGNVSIAGTLTYQDVTNMDVLGIGTFQQGIQVLANGVDVTGIGTFEDRITYDGSLGQAGGTTVTYAVTVATKDSTHRYNGSGSGNGYVIDNLQAPVITVTPGRTYRFTNDNTGSHPLKFYLEADKTTLYETGVTFNDAYTEIVVSDTTPAVLHYQCTAHSLMGNSIITQSNEVNTPYQIDGLKGASITGVVTATDFNSTSDTTVKENIQVIEDPLASIIRIDGVTFTWKDSGKNSAGVTAQNLEEVLPNLVSNGDLKSVNYNGLVGYLIEAVKSQQEQIDELKSRLDSLDS